MKRAFLFLVRLCLYIPLGYFILLETGYATLSFYAAVVLYKEYDWITLPPFHDKEMAAILASLDLDDVIEIVKDKENWELSQVAKLETVVSNSEGLYHIESVREASSEMKSILDNYR